MFCFEACGVIPAGFFLRLTVALYSYCFAPRANFLWTLAFKDLHWLKHSASTYRVASMLLVFCQSKLKAYLNGRTIYATLNMDQWGTFLWMCYTWG